MSARLFYERDLRRRSELVGQANLTMAEETELAHVVARIRSSETAYNGTSEGRALL